MADAASIGAVARDGSGPGPAAPQPRLLDRLLAVRRGGAPIASLAADERPADLDTAYATAAALVQRLGWTPAGAKVGANGPPGQRALRLAEPLWGHTLAERTWQREGQLAAGGGDTVAEAEWVLTLGAGIDAEAARDPERVRAAVAHVCLGIEINQPSYVDAINEGGLAVIADNGVHAGLVLGPPLPAADWSALVARDVWLRCEGGSFDDAGDAAVAPLPPRSAAAAGIDPLAALVWLAADSARRGAPLAAGHTVATGAIVVAPRRRAGQRVTAGFGDDAQCTVRIT